MPGKFKAEHDWVGGIAILDGDGNTALRLLKYNHNKGHIRNVENTTRIANLIVDAANGDFTQWEQLLLGKDKDNA